MSRIVTESINVGAHEFQFVPPDQLRFRFCGVFLEKEVEAYLDFIYTHGSQANGKLYVAYDLSQWTRIDEGARKRTTAVEQPYPFEAMAITGANFSTRALASMLLRAGKVIRPAFFSFSYKFVASMDEANSWFDELRAEKNRI